MIRAGPEQAATLAALHAAAFPHDPWSEADFAILLRQPGVSALIDRRGGLLLLREVADEAEILTLGAEPARQGIGRALLEAGLAELRSRHVATLHLEVAASNFAARALYAALGFAPAGRRRDYYRQGEDALLLSRPVTLSPPSAAP